MGGKRHAKPHWAKKLPKSKMQAPDSLLHALKYFFWILFTPIHPYMRDLGLKLGVIWHDRGRQNYLLGKVSDHVPLEKFVEHLVQNGYGNHHVAWEDEDEIINLRKTEGFEYQYHVRIYADGEVRGHFEYTPECYPILHMKEADMEARRDHFLKLMEGKITAVREV